MWFIRLRQHSAMCPHLLSSSNEDGCPCPQSLEQADDDGIMPLDVQRRAWETIDSLSVDEILRSLPPRTVQHMPYCLRTLFQECCSVPLSKISEDPGYDGGWKLLMLLPRMIMRPHPREGRSGIKEIKAIYHRFLGFHSKELIELHNHSHAQQSNNKGEDQRRKAALRHVKCGELSRAAKILTSHGFAPPSEESIQRLRAKHPARKMSLTLSDVDEVSSIQLKKSVVLESSRKSPRGSRAGPSGWRFEHLRVLQDNASTSNLLFSLCSLIAEDKVPPSAVPLLSCSRLIALPKSNGDVRPIAIGETLRRLTAKAICFQLRSSFSTYFEPIQHGVATPCGGELLAHHVTLLLDGNSDLSLLKTDISNAFNCISRQHLLDEVAEKFPEITVTRARCTVMLALSYMSRAVMSSLLSQKKECTREIPRLFPLLCCFATHFGVSTGES